VVTVSASYGAGGSVIAPGLAKRVGLPFYDRLLHGPETRSAEHIIERLSEEERQQAPPSRAMANLGHMSAGLGFPVPAAADLDPYEDMRATVEASIRRIARGSGGVILGRGAVVVLGRAPNAFHVRLDGPLERRVAQGMAIEGVTGDVARAHQADADRAWSQFGQRVFHRDFTDARLYHLVLDSTAVPLDDCVSVIATATTAYWRRNGCG
jgi:cytidylate kinase